MIRSVITVTTGVPGRLAFLARTAGRDVIAWNDTISAGRCLATAAPTILYTGANTARSQSQNEARPLVERQKAPQSQGVSLIPGPYKAVTQRSRAGVPRWRSGSSMTGANRPG